MGWAGLIRRDGEPERAHRAFLLWAMQAQRRRSFRATGRALGSKSGSSERKWCTVWDWKARVGEDPSTESKAAELYAQKYHGRYGGREVRQIADNMDINYVPPGKTTKVAEAVEAHDALEGARKMQLRKKRAGDVLDASLARFSDQLIGEPLVGQDGKPVLDRNGKQVRYGFDYRPSDLPGIVRGYQALNQLGGGMLGIPEVDTGSGGSIGDNVARSERVRQAEEKGVAVLPALIEDLEEMRVIAEVMLEHEAAQAEETKKTAGAGGYNVVQRPTREG